MAQALNGFCPDKRILTALYRRLHAAYGPQQWWPADTPFEVAVGAVLTQNTAWSNVEKAIFNLRSAGVLAPEAILQLPPGELADLVRPSGYFNIKAERLRQLSRCVLDCGGIAGCGKLDTPTLRARLLGVKGVGPETADDILLYAFDRPVFVIDTYTRRLLQRHRLATGDEPYEVLRAGFERALPSQATLLGEYHALIVVHAKASCRKVPACAGCAIRPDCPGRSPD